VSTTKELRALAYKLYDKVLEMEQPEDGETGRREGGARLFDYCIDVEAEDGFDESRVDPLLEPLIEILAAWEKRSQLK
jgi:hypothetical protein